MTTRFVLTTLATSFIGFVSLGTLPTMAQGNQESVLKCTLMTDVKPVDGAYKSVGIRRPKVLVGDQRVTDMNVQVMEVPSLARVDVGDGFKILEVWDCGNQTGYKMKAATDDAYDMTEIMLPEGIAVGTVIKSCSKGGGCVTGTFESFDKWVTLKVGATTGSAKITGTYKD